MSHDPCDALLGTHPSHTASARQGGNYSAWSIWFGCDPMHAVPGADRPQATPLQDPKDHGVRASYLCGQMPGTTTSRRLRLGASMREPETAVKADVANSTAPALFPFTDD